MRPGETFTQYIDRVGNMEKQLISAGENFKELDKVCTMLRGLLDKYSTTRDLMRELKKSLRETIAMITAKAAELKAFSSKLGSYLAPNSHT